MKLPDGTEASLKYLEPKKGKLVNQGPFWEGSFERVRPQLCPEGNAGRSLWNPGEKDAFFYGRGARQSFVRWQFPG